MLRILVFVFSAAGFWKTISSTPLNLPPADSFQSFKFLLERLEPGDVVEFKLHSRKTGYCGEISRIRRGGADWHIQMVSASLPNIPDYCRGYFQTHYFSISPGNANQENSLSLAELAFIDLLDPGHEYLLYTPEARLTKIVRPITSQSGAFAEIKGEPLDKIKWKKIHRVARFFPGIFYPDLFFGVGAETLPGFTSLTPVYQIQLAWLLHRQLPQWRLMLSLDHFSIAHNPYPDNVFPQNIWRPGAGAMYYLWNTSLLNLGVGASLQSYFFSYYEYEQRRWGVRPSLTLYALLEYDAWFLARDKHKVGLYIKPETGHILQQSGFGSSWTHWLSLSAGVKYAY